MNVQSLRSIGTIYTKISTSTTIQQQKSGLKTQDLKRPKPPAQGSMGAMAGLGAVAGLAAAGVAGQRASKGRTSMQLVRKTINPKP